MGVFDGICSTKGWLGGIVASMFLFYFSGCHQSPEKKGEKAEAKPAISIPTSSKNAVVPSFEPFPWVRYEAEDARTTGQVRGPSRVYYSPESESSGRRYVRLESEGQFVEFTAIQSGEGLVVRYSIPDTPEGDGQNATLSLYRNGKYEKKLLLTSRHAWSYGNFPWSNNPKEGKPHHFYDEARSRVDEIKVGDTIRLQKDAKDIADYYLIDLIELEKVPPPLTRPSNSFSIAEFGAKGDDDMNDTPALLECLSAASSQNKIVWIPRGDFRLDGERITLGKVAIQGEGMWYSCLTGKKPMFAVSGQPVLVSDLAIMGDTNDRNDSSPDNAFDGNFGDGSIFRHLWIEHLKCGFWTTHGTRNMRLEGCRIRNTMADGLNFCDGSTDSSVELCHLRSTGDDALATWSPGREKQGSNPCLRNSFVNNRIELPWHANGLAIYGGGYHRIAGNTVTDTVFSGGGLLISSGFESIPFSGEILVENNTFIRTGGECYIGEPVGGLWIHCHHSDIEVPVHIRGTSLIDSAQSAISVHGPKGAQVLQLDDVRVDGLAQEPIHIFPKTYGKMEVRSIATKNVATQNPLRNESPEKFDVMIRE